VLNVRNPFIIGCRYLPMIKISSKSKTWEMYDVLEVFTKLKSFSDFPDLMGIKGALDNWLNKPGF
jgi:hypothetical protein